MTSTIGWVEYAPDALRRMQRELDEEEEGVVDELGLLAIHTGYANHFFLGMFVLY